VRLGRGLGRGLLPAGEEGEGKKGERLGFVREGEWERERGGGWMDGDGEGREGK